MDHYHLNREELRRLKSGDLTQAETTQLSRHLIDCAACRRAVYEVASEPADQLKALLEDLSDRGLVESNGGGNGRFNGEMGSNGTDLESISSPPQPKMVDPRTMLDTLRALPAEEQGGFLRTESSSVSLDLVELLLQESWDDRTRNPQTSEEWAQLALDALDLLDHDFADLHRLRDLQARAWIYRANSRRIRFLMPEAAEAFQRAEDLLVEGSREPRLRALLLELKGIYLRESQRCDEALRVLDQAIAIHRWAENPEGECACLITKANVFEMLGDLDPAISTLEKASQLLEPTFDPYLAVCVQQNRAVYLMQAGRPKEAETLLPQLRQFIHQSGMRITQLRLNWLEGQIATKLGDLERAEAILHRVRGRFLAEEMGYEAAQVSLELAALYLEHGRTAETRQLAREMVQVFDRLDIQREAFTALMMFQKAALSERATAGMAREIFQVLEQLKARPVRRPELPS